MSTPTKPIILYWDTLSGHSHRVQLFLSLTGLPFEIKQIHLKQGEHKKPEFLALNPNGQLPAIDDNGTIVFDSNAILTYLATKYDAARAWLPTDPTGLADVVRFLSFAAGPIEFSAADARLINVFGATSIDRGTTQRVAGKFFPMLDRHLENRSYVLGDTPTIADVANYTYIAHAPEGDIDLIAYANIRSWLDRIEALPGFVPMQRTAVGLQKTA